MSDVDTMRWGDSQTLNFVGAAGEGGSASTKQMLQANWQRPVVWRLLLVFTPQISAGSGLGSFDILTEMFLGIGQTNAVIPFGSQHFVNPGTLAPVVVFQDIPAESLSLRFTIANVTNTPSLADYVTVAAFIAPRAEPGAIAQMRDRMGAPREGVTQPDREGLPHWMPPGFNDGELRYRRG